jgi:serine/threonine protein kinase
MQHYQARNIVHRDIKPDNMMIGNDGRVRIVDFGIAAKIKAKEFIKESTGTMLYSAPEVLMNHTQQCSDVWSLGCVLYQMVTHDFPFNHDSTGHLIKLIKAGTYKPLPEGTS